jgi:serine/threonine protein kinase
LLAATFVLYRLADEAGHSVATFYPGDRSTPLSYACWASVFSGMAAGVSTFVSSVIYGLQREVQKARKLGQYTLERRHISRRVAGALSEAHERGLIHRDIKPSNIMVCEHGGASVTQAGHITGTPLYLSPEQIRTPDDLDGRSDLYALGAVGYFLLSGNALFSGSVVEVCAHRGSDARDVGPPSDSER